MTRCLLPVAVVAVIFGSIQNGRLRAAAPNASENAITLENVVAPDENSPDEPKAEFSLEAATRFLDSAALNWQKEKACFTCHTNFAYLMARPAISADVPAHKTVRAFAESLVTERWPKEGPRWDAEVVAAGAILAYNDDATTGKLHDVTRTALDRMWTVQREDGGWDWLKCDWPPMESDDHYGATLAAIGVGVAPDGYAHTPAAKAGMEKLRGYLAKNPPPTTHHKAMLLWAASYTPDLMSESDRAACIAELSALQHSDGGWGLATLGDWKRKDGSPQDLAASDGYGTGFVIYVLTRAGVPADDARLQKGVAWLKESQRKSGRWFTRSVHADSKHFISHAGTAFAVMALAAVDAAKGKPDKASPEPVKLLEVDSYCEGVVFDKDGAGYISHGEVIVKFTLDGKHSVWANTGAPNGHKIMADGSHLVCDAKSHAVLHLDANGKLLDPAAKELDGKPLLGPNDLSLDTDHGGVYFSDPGESSKDNPIGQICYLDAHGKVTKLDGGLAYPNGIVLSADGKRLYLAESQHNRVLTYEVQGPGKLGERKVFADLPAMDKNRGQIDNQPDGMCLDAAGNLYVAHYGMKQVQVLSPDGKLSRQLDGGNVTTSNVAFGGPELDQLFVTGGMEGFPSKGGLFRHDLGVKGLRVLPKSK